MDNEKKPQADNIPEQLQAEKLPQTDKLPEPPQEPAGAGLSHKRKQALVMYLAILFLVAFVLVAVSLVIQNHNLSDSHANYASALEKAEALQDENRELILQAENTKEAYDLLLRAQNAVSERKMERFVELMQELASVTEYFSEDGIAAYNDLLLTLPDAIAATATTID